MDRDEPEMAARQASIFAWADSGEPITGNPQPKRSNASFDKNRELPPSIYKLCSQLRGRGSCE